MTLPEIEQNEQEKVTEIAFLESSKVILRV